MSPPEYYTSQSLVRFISSLSVYINTTLMYLLLTCDLSTRTRDYVTRLCIFPEYDQSPEGKAHRFSRRVILSYYLQQEHGKASRDREQADADHRGAGGRDSRGRGARTRASAAAAARARGVGHGAAASSGGRVRGLHGGCVQAAGVVGAERAGVVDADALQLGALGRDHGGGGGAAHAEQAVEGGAHGGEVRGGDAEGRGGHGDLGDEVAHLGVAEVHELVHAVHGRVSAVGGEGAHAVLGAAQQGTEELVQMREEEAVKILLLEAARHNEFSQDLRDLRNSREGIGHHESWTYYWLEEVSLAGMFFIKGAAPPPSRKLTATPALPPRLLDSRPPSK